MIIDNLIFSNFTYNERRETVTSVDSTGKYLIKVQLVANPRKSHDILGEYEVMKQLNIKDCKSCPTAYESGKVTSTYLRERGVETPASDNTFGYIIQDYAKNEGNYSVADLLLSVIEQKKLGFYQGDIKPSNVRFNPDTGVCILIDYDQSLRLTQEQKEMNNREFLAFCDSFDKEKYGFGNWLRHYTGVTSKDLEPFFVNGSLNLANTSLFRMQKTTNSQSGIYHTIDSNDVFAKGSRGLEKRAEILSQVQFSSGERVLDVGCNAGLLCEYLHDRGCKVTGVDNDPHIVVAAKILSNILGRSINYGCMDLDYVDDVGDFDTIMLFSVFHHTRNPEKNAKKITKACKRIIIETRLVENGKQPIDGSWVDTTRWSFQELNELTSYLERIFSGFKYTRNLGFADKGRYILELVKQ